MEDVQKETPQETKVFKDCAHRPIHVGMFVATARDGYTGWLTVARVIGFTKKKVRIKYKDQEESTKFGIQLCIIG